jgi:hypothetical protein
MLASYHWISCLTMILSPSLEDEQWSSVGVLLTVVKLCLQILHKINEK